MAVHQASNRSRAAIRFPKADVLSMHLNENVTRVTLRTDLNINGLIAARRSMQTHRTRRVGRPIQPFTRISRLPDNVTARLPRQLNKIY